MISSDLFLQTGYLKIDGSFGQLQGTYYCTDYIEIPYQLFKSVTLYGMIGDTDASLPNVCLYNEQKKFLRYIKFNFKEDHVTSKQEYDFSNLRESPAGD